MSKTLELGYWDIRALGQPCRNLLTYVGADWTDHKLTAMPEWLALKVDLADRGCEFPNLPYLVIPPGEDVDGQNAEPLIISQSLAVMRWIARKFNVGLRPGSSGSDVIRADVLEQQLHDLRMGHLRLSYFEWDFSKKRYDDALPGEVAKLSKSLQDQKWLMGDYVTYLDFLAHETLDWLRLYKEDCLSGHANLLDYMDRFEGLDRVGTYLKSADYHQWPIFAPFARWGNQGWRHAYNPPPSAGQMKKEAGEGGGPPTASK